MKTIEEQAKAYNAALEMARQAFYSPETPHFAKAWLLTMFPTIAESDDERIKREILELVSIAGNGNQFEEIKDWLEKQGEQPTDKVEPKFKVGDWVVFPMGIIGRIDTLDDVNYQVTTTDGYNFDYKISKQHFYRLWSINDAKDGDVLYSIDSKQPFIYKERPQFSQARGYCFINKFGEFAVWNTSKCIICTDKYIPATKEQRSLFFEKIKEAGYEWDAERKELKKIEPKKLDPDKVIAWLKTKVYDDSAYGMAMIEQFKKDFEI